MYMCYIYIAQNFFYLRQETNINNEYNSFDLLFLIQESYKKMCLR